jgi:hypothetical protein
MFPELRRDMTLAQFYDYVKKLESQNPGILNAANLTPGRKFPIISIKAGKGTGSKQHVLLTAMHSGIEYSGSNTLIRLLEWLVSGDPDVEKALSQCIINIIPIPNPHGYNKGEFNGQFRTELGGDPYSVPWSVEGVADPDTNWEAAAIQRLIDDFQPELYIDCHGVFYKNQTMIENTGVSVHGMNRPHHTGFVNMINDAAKELGYHSEQFELRQKSLPVVPGLADRRYQTCSPAITPCTYAYHNYHTLAMTMEIGHEESGFARLKKSLSLADFHWPGEQFPGYPVNRLYGEGHFGLHPCSISYPYRRTQRVALWKAVNNFATASIQPQYPGSDGFIILSPEDAEKTSTTSHGWSYHPWDVVLKEGRWLGLNLPKITKLPEVPFSISIKVPFAKSIINSVKENGKITDKYKTVDFGSFKMVFFQYTEGVNNTIFCEINYSYSLGT